MKKKLIIGGILVLVGLGGWWWYRVSHQPLVVATDTVRRGDVVETVSVTGELEPVQYADLAFPGSGVLNKITVKTDDVVKAGDLIATLDQSVLRSQLRAGTVALSIAEANERLARRNWKDLKPEEKIAKRLATEEARVNVQTLKAELEKSELRAPFDGRISKTDVREGELVSLGTTIARLVRDSSLVITARVPESDITKIDLGMEATVDFDAFSADEKYSARVTKIDMAATVVQDVVSYQVEFELQAQNPRLREGMTANIDIETAKRTGVLTVPFRALSKEGGRYFAEVLRASNQFDRVEVGTGLEGDEGTIEITAGLQEGDTVTIGAKQAK